MILLRLQERASVWAIGEHNLQTILVWLEIHLRVWLSNARVGLTSSPLKTTEAEDYRLRPRNSTGTLLAPAHPLTGDFVWHLSGIYSAPMKVAPSRGIEPRFGP